ncbi:hybrid sensor histidine kinase/response regulator [Paludisphaera rhizosphaerae]|uniref:hybrid sensor histidine kinase/response regulator n=1 Tax=Paludisphaera rhizosphaerae TaxID=2711216 RepID=UPI0013EA32C6|nr:ATP-binding protein [Paludisphaera rhizosphaerae]
MLSALVVVLASWLCGAVPALLALGVMLAGFSWASSTLMESSTTVGMSLYALGAAAITWLGARMRSSLMGSETARWAATVEGERLLGEQAALLETAEAQSRRLEELLGELREKNAFLMAILSQAPSGVLVVEAGTSRLILSNAEADRISRGRLRPAEPIEGALRASDRIAAFRSDGTRYAPEEWPLIRSVQTGEAVCGEEIEIAFPDGERRRLLVRSGPAVDETGRMIAAVAVFDDVTERRAAEDALAESERRFRQLAELIPQVVYITRPDDTIAFLNRRWFEYTGASSDHVDIKDAWLESIHPDDRARVLSARARSKDQGEPTEVEYRVRGRDGSYRWFLGRSKWMRDEAGALWQRFGTATDIDDRRRAEQGARFLADAGGRLAEVADAETTLREIARLAVPQFADWCAVDVLEQGGELRRVAVAHEDDPTGFAEVVSHRYRLRPDTPEGLYEVIRNGRPSLVPEVGEVHLRAAAQNEEHLKALRAFQPKSYLCVPMNGRDGVLGAISFTITRSGRRYDRADLELAVDLAGRAGIALENGMLYDRLREDDRRKTDFLATLAHELRNPMAAINNATQLLRRPGATENDLDWAGGVVERQVQHLVHLVDGLLDVSRLTRGRLVLKLEPTSLSAVVASGIETSRSTLEARRQTLRVDLPTEPVSLVVDPTRIAQAVACLLENASKFSEVGESIELHVAVVDGKAEIRVADRGVGLDPKHFAHLFEPFIHFAPVLERAKGGLGIGLALVKGIVELHGGAVEARSEGIGRGSEFILRLPLPVVETRPAARRTAGPGRRVLVVDDSPESRKSLGGVVSRSRCEFYEARDGRRALSLAAEVRPDFAVVDVDLPDMSGYELAEAVRREPWGRDVVLVAVTGWGRRNDRKRSVEAGFDHHLVKPVDFDALAQILGEPPATST